MLSVYGERVEHAETQLVALRDQLRQAERRLEETGRKNASALDRLLEELKPAPPPDVPSPTAAPRFRTYEFEKTPARSIHVPAGSFGEATLLTGVFAPVGGEPLPVLLRLDAALVGPQRSRVPLPGAFLVGKAQGDVNSRRAVVQLETLSAVGPDGKPAEVRVNGWVIDEDGVQGVRGAYVWHADQVVALSTLTGGLSGGAEALAQRETLVQATPLGGTQSAVTGDAARFAGSRSLSTAFGRLSEIVTRRLDEIVPAVVVPNARRVTVAFITGVTLEGYGLPETPRSPFQGLDR